jgi:DNA-binding MarR family transcriptional regulator
MKSSLQAEIKQEKPFDSLQEELWLNLSRTTAMVGHHIEQGLRPHGLSPTQYNVLRILRGAGPQGLCQYEIAERLVAEVPDVPRIVDRMEKAGWVARERGMVDRRVVRTTLTPLGADLVGDLDSMMTRLTCGIFDALTEGEMERLIELLEAARTTGKRN